MPQNVIFTSPLRNKTLSRETPSLPHPSPSGYSPAPLYYYVGMVVEGVSSSSPFSCSPCNPFGRLVSSTSPPVPSTNSSYVDFSLKGLGPKSSIISSRPSTSFSRRRKAIWQGKNTTLIHNKKDTNNRSQLYFCLNSMAGKCCSSLDLPAFHHECRSLIGCATRWLFRCR